jgi:trk system potassium uptake protein TrkA
MKVVIAGLGDVGRGLAEALARSGENKLVLIEQDEALCAQLSEALDALVLYGDGSDPRMLDEAGLDDADALIATTGSDPLNTVIAMLGRQRGAKRIMVRLNDVWLRPACHEMGVAKVVTPKVSAVGELLAALHGLERLSSPAVVQGGLHITELAAGTAAGQKVSDLPLPKRARLVALVRDDEVRIVDQDTKVEAEDLLLVAVPDRKVLDATVQALAPERGES